VNVQVDVRSKEQEVCESTPDLFTTFIVGQMEKDGHTPPPALLKRRNNQESDVARVLRDIGDDIVRNYSLQHSINEMKVTTDTAYKTFATVVSEIFSDGGVNWGRIVMVFYFAYRLALKVLNEIPLLEIIIGWVKKFVADKLAAWISSRGGWEAAITEYRRSQNVQLFSMFVAGFALASFCFWYMKKK